MKLVKVSMGNFEGKLITCKSYQENFTIGKKYKVVKHEMDEDSWNNAHYFVLMNDNGSNERVPASSFNYY